MFSLLLNDEQKEGDKEGSERLREGGKRQTWEAIVA